MKRIVLSLLALTLAACSDDDNGPGANFEDVAVIAARTPDFSAGAISLVATDEPHAAQNNLNATISDIVVRSGGDHYFVLERFGTDRISRYEAAAPATRVFQYSTKDTADTASSNPSDLIIASPTKAYLLRYGSSKLWIVNPSAASEAEFRTGEIDLSGYDRFDGIPEMTAGIIRDGRLYVAMQRLENFSAVKDAFVAVIDVATDTEITAGTAVLVKGVRLPVRNPTRLEATSNGDILVVASGGFDDSFSPVYDGGIARIDADNFATSVIVDDGSSGAAPFGQITDMAIAADDRGYFVGSTGFFGSQTVYRFNPAGGSAPVAVPDLSEGKYGALAVSPEGQLFVGLEDDEAPGVAILGFTGGTEAVLAERVDTALTPINIDFVTVEQP